MSDFIEDELNRDVEIERVKKVNYVIDFEKVKTLEDIKSILKVFDSTWSMSKLCVEELGVEHLVKPDNKITYSLKRRLNE